MATFKAFVFSVVVVLSLSKCTESTSNSNKKTPVLPQMTKEEGKIITSREINVWEYSKTKQYDKLREILADDYVGYFSAGNMQPSTVINLLKKTTFTDYHLSDINVKPITNDVAIITYNVLQDITGDDGVKWMPKISAASSYVKRNGIWYSIFYQEMPAK